MSEEKSIEPLELYRTVRAQIEHEDNLVSQRLSWLLASQSFLFTAFAITLNGPSQSHFRSFESLSDLLIRLLEVVGLISALLIWISILAGIGAMRRLRTTLHQELRDSLLLKLPPVQTTGFTLRAGQFAPVLTPLLIMGIWLILILKG